MRSAMMTAGSLAARDADERRVTREGVSTADGGTSTDTVTDGVEERRARATKLRVRVRKKEPPGGTSTETSPELSA